MRASLPLRGSALAVRLGPEGQGAGPGLCELLPGVQGAPGEVPVDVVRRHLHRRLPRPLVDGAVRLRHTTARKRIGDAFCTVIKSDAVQMALSLFISPPFDP